LEFVKRIDRRGVHWGESVHFVFIAFFASPMTA
jgi:hypothetical protein